MGTLVVAWRSDESLVSEHVPAVAEFAERAAIALVAARSHRDRERLALFEERDRIARDMHDNVVQRLFATGLALQSAAPLAEHPVVRSRMHHAVDELDSAIKEIREAIFELHAAEPLGLLDEVQGAVEGFAELLGFVPELVVDGRLGRIPVVLRPTLLAVIREALANVARHARAAHVRITLAVDDGSVTVTVTDDGVGLGDALPQSGLVNLRERAEAIGGRFVLTTTPGEGTTLSWSVPLKGSPA
jgi:signal transduction histidine kinase